MSKSKTAENKRLQIVEAVDCDTSRLYGSLKDAIAYLQEIRAKYPGVDITLEEHWTGYEDMEMRFSYNREENDTEYGRRLAEEARQAKEADRKRAEEAEKAKRRKEWEKLNREFGRSY